MSYRNPKYTYVSQQPAFDKLQKTVDAAVDNLATRKETARKEEVVRAEKNYLYGQGVGQDILNKEIDYSYGGQQQGAATTFFKGWSAKAGDLARNTYGTNPKCEQTGDCDIQRRRLAVMQGAPEAVKGLLTNSLSFLNGGEGMYRFDAGQNGNAVLASNILAGKQGFGKDADYIYRIEEAEDEGGFNLVFEYTGDDDSKKFTDSNGKLVNSQSYNSLQLEKANRDNQNILNKTSKTSEQINNAMVTSGIIPNSTADKNGVLVQGSGDYNVSVSNLLLDEGGTVESGSREINGFKVQMYQRIIDKEKVRMALQPTLKGQINYFTGSKEESIKGNDGEMRAYWNMVLRKGNAIDFNSQSAKNVFGESKTIDGKKVDYTEAELKKLWKDATTGDTSYWNTSQKITDLQNKIFAEVYTNEIVNGTTFALQNDVRNKTNISDKNAPVEVTQKKDDTSFGPGSLMVTSELTSQQSFDLKTMSEVEFKKKYPNVAYPSQS